VELSASGGIRIMAVEGMMINEQVMLFKKSETEEDKRMELSALISAVNTSDYKCRMFCESTRSCLMSNALLIN
jgi:hypothetical protein